MPGLQPGGLHRREKPAGVTLRRRHSRMSGSAAGPRPSGARPPRGIEAQLEERAASCEGDSFRWSPGAGSRAYREEQAEADACQQVTHDLDMNRRWLETLTENAHRAGAPPGWLR